MHTSDDPPFGITLALNVKPVADVDRDVTRHVHVMTAEVANVTLASFTFVAFPEQSKSSLAETYFSNGLTECFI